MQCCRVCLKCMFLCVERQHTKEISALLPTRPVCSHTRCGSHFRPQAKPAGQFPFGKPGNYFGTFSGVWALALSQRQGVSGLLVVRRTTGNLPKITQISVTEGLMPGLRSGLRDGSLSHAVATVEGGGIGMQKLCLRTVKPVDLGQPTKT